MPSLPWCRSLGTLTLVLAGGLCLAGAGNPEKGEIRTGVSKENFAKIKNDMAEKDVLELLGKPGASSVRDLPERGKVTISLWNSGGDIIAVTFKDGKVLAKIATIAPAAQGVAALVRTYKALMEELKNAKGDPAKAKDAQVRMIAIMKKLTSLTEAEKKEFGELMRKEFGAPKRP